MRSKVVFLLGAALALVLAHIAVASRIVAVHNDEKNAGRKHSCPDEGCKEASCMLSCFTVKDDYDYTNSTKDNYEDRRIQSLFKESGYDLTVSLHGDPFIGKYKHLRSTLDHSWHGFYTKERMMWQDAAIDSLVESIQAADPPWVIYTAGGMGAGKGHVMDMLSKMKLFAKDSFAKMDPDAFKFMMPEFKLYPRDNGNMCHREGGMLAEVASLAVLEKSANLIVDGTLQDMGWNCGTGQNSCTKHGSEDWMGVIRLAKYNYPTYRIAIFHIVMDVPETELEGIVTSRLAAREAKTGRNTRLDLALKSYSDSAATVQKVEDDMTGDLVVRFDSTGDGLHIKSMLFNDKIADTVTDSQSPMGPCESLLAANFGPQAQMSSVSPNKEPAYKNDNVVASGKGSWQCISATLQSGECSCY